MMRIKPQSMILSMVTSRWLAIILSAVTFAFAIPSNAGGQVLIRPKIQKDPFIIKMPNLAIVDLVEGDTPSSVFVQVGNLGSANAGVFYVRLSLKKKGSTTKTYVEKRVAGLNAKTDVPLNIEIGQPIAGLEIGIFIDARQQIAESDEANCGKLYPDGGVSGSEPCKGF
jgi:hypothetical protein